MGQSKISVFRGLLDAGKEFDEAMNAAGIAKTTAKIQFAKWKKEKAEDQS